MTWDPSILLELFPPTPVGTGRSSMTAIDMFAGWGGFSLGDELLDVFVYKYFDARTRDDVELWDDFEIDLRGGA